MGRELPDREHFLTLSQFQERLDEWKEEYNEERPHSACARHPSYTLDKQRANYLPSLRTLSFEMALLWGIGQCQFPIFMEINRKIRYAVRNSFLKN